jgi:hypothetical protein
LALRNWYDAARRHHLDIHGSPNHHFSHHHAGNFLLWLLSPEFVLSFAFSPCTFLRVLRASVIFLPSTTSISFISSVNSIPLELSFAMPRERGKSKHGPTYYSQVGRHRRTRPPSLFPNPGSSSTRSPNSGQNWCEDAQPEFHSLNPELNYGGCIVEEEIPPNWEENTMEQTTPIGTGFPLNSLEIAMGGCMVEEEIPPLMQDNYKNDADPNDEDPWIKWGDCWSKEETHREIHTGTQAHPALGCHDLPSSCRLTEDHLVLIFEMRKDLVEQLHNQHVLSKRLDILFNSLSSEPVKSRCPTCCQPFAFTVRHDGRPGSPHI